MLRSAAARCEVKTAVQPRRDRLDDAAEARAAAVAENRGSIVQRMERPAVRPGARRAPARSRPTCREGTATRPAARAPAGGDGRAGTRPGRPASAARRRRRLSETRWTATAAAVLQPAQPGGEEVEGQHMGGGEAQPAGGGTPRAPRSRPCSERAQRHRRAAAGSRRPAAVRRDRLRCSRSNKAVPAQSSSARMRRLKAGWVTLRALRGAGEVAGLGQGLEVAEPGRGPWRRCRCRMADADQHGRSDIGHWPARSAVDGHKAADQGRTRHAHRRRPGGHQADLVAHPQCLYRLHAR